MIDFLNTPKFALMQKSLDVLWQRQQVTADNIANVDTPDYKAKRLVFEEILSEEIKRVDKGLKSNKYTRGYALERIKSVNPRVVTDNSTEQRVDGSNVDIDYENVELAKSKIQYDYMVRKITDEYRLLKLAVTEGRG